MKYKYLVVAIVAPLILIADQLTKLWVVKLLPIGEKISVIPGYLEIVHVRNTGAAFGMLSEVSPSLRLPFFYAVAILATIVIVLMLWKTKESDRLLPFAFALIFGGMAGNIIDRIKYGSVVDFVFVHWRDVILSKTILNWHIVIPLDWPAFNIADSAITIAMILLVWEAFRGHYISD